MSHVIFYFFFPPHWSVVQRGRLVKSMSLVPSQDKVLLALSPSALINSRLTAHTQRKWYIHQHITLHTHTSFDGNNLCNNSDLCGPVHRPHDSKSAANHTMWPRMLCIIPFFYHTVYIYLFFSFLTTAVLSIMHQWTKPKHVILFQLYLSCRCGCYTVIAAFSCTIIQALGYHKIMFCLHSAFLFWSIMLLPLNNNVTVFLWGIEMMWDGECSLKHVAPAPEV